MTAPFFITVTIEGAPELSRTLSSAVVGVSDFRPMWDRIADDYVATRKDVFKTRGRSIGFPWPGYTADELRYKVVKGKILGLGTPAPDSLQLRWIGRERLYPGITRRTSPDFVFRSHPMMSEYGTRVPYAHNHEFGVGRGPRWAGSYPIPMRKYVQPLGRNFEGKVSRRLGAFAGATHSAIAIKSADVRAAIAGGM